MLILPFCEYFFCISFSLLSFDFDLLFPLRFFDLEYFKHQTHQFESSMIVLFHNLFHFISCHFISFINIVNISKSYTHIADTLTFSQLSRFHSNNQLSVS
jgi:hypothetical protein